MVPCEDVDFCCWTCTSRTYPTCSCRQQDSALHNFDNLPFDGCRVQSDFTADKHTLAPKSPAAQPAVTSGTESAPSLASRSRHGFLGLLRKLGILQTTKKSAAIKAAEYAPVKNYHEGPRNLASCGAGYRIENHNRTFTLGDDEERGRFQTAPSHSVPEIDQPTMIKNHVNVEELHEVRVRFP